MTVLSVKMYIESVKGPWLMFHGGGGGCVVVIVGVGKLAKQSL